MGATIGQTPAVLARLDSFTVRRRARTGEERLSGQARDRGGEEADVRAGFGEGTLSTQGAALKTVSTNLRRARELVPTVEELQARARAAAAEAAARLERSAEQAPAAETAAPEKEEATPTLVTAKPQADPRARFFAQEEDNAPSRVAPTAQPLADESPAPTAPATRDRAAALLDVLA